MTVIPLRAGRQQQIPILAAGPLGGRGRVGRQPADGGAVNFPQGDYWPATPESGHFPSAPSLWRKQSLASALPHAWPSGSWAPGAVGLGRGWGRGQISAAETWFMV